MKFVVDIDGTLLYTEIVNGKYVVTNTNDPLINKLNELWDIGHEIILHTGRHWNHLDDTKLQLLKAKIFYDSLVMGKPPADYYIDDKAITPVDFVDIEL